MPSSLRCLLHKVFHSIRYAAVLVPALLLLACSHGLPKEWHSLRHLTTATNPQTRDPARLSVEFLGAGGVFLHYGDISLLGDPFFSNPPLSDLLTLSRLQVRTDVIDAHLPPLDQVKAILVGHAHYDHALDVPYVASKLPDSVKIYGSATLKNLLASQVAADRIVALNDRMANQGKGGAWIYLHPRLRILPVRSEHSPHVGHTVFMSDPVTSPQQEMPVDALDWKAGTNLSFVIDFLGAGADGDAGVAYRVFYQSSASNAPVGFPPDWVLQDGVPFDIALICGANYTHVTGYPEGLLSKIHPRAVMLIHWEKFWQDYTAADPEPLPGMNFADLESRIRQAVGPSAAVWVPNRGSIVQLDRFL